MSHTRRLTTIALLGALAVTLGFVESMIPIPLGVPGVKIGLGNICVLVALYLIDTRSAFVVMLFKVCLVSLLFASPFALAYSLAGTLLSFAGMWLLSRWGRVNVIVVSIVAAILHNTAQVLVAAWLLDTSALLWYLPVLSVVACVTGTATGAVASGLLKALKPEFRVGAKRADK